MSLSAAIIVKDEAEHLDACLASLRGLTDEIVVVDLGSTDDSAAVARAHGATVVHEPWQGDVATPRNRGLDLATGDWVLFIDADERAQGIAVARGRNRSHPDDQLLYVDLVHHLLAGGVVDDELALLVEEARGA